MIKTTPVEMIDADEINSWIETHLQPRYPAETEIGVLPRRGQDATGESKFMALVDINEVITVDELVSRVADEHSRGRYVLFYIDDILQAAVGTGDLTGDWYFVNYAW